MVASAELSLTEARSMTVSQYDDASRRGYHELGFTMNIASSQIPVLSEETVCITAREKVDLTAMGVDEREASQVAVNQYGGKMPRQPADLPPGFKELKGEKR